MSQANAAEQLMLTLINEERQAAGLDPLRFNGDLNEAAEDHSDWMLQTDRFSHDGEGGSSVRDRAVEAGYELEGNWAIGENIGWQSERGAPGIEDDVRDIHRGLMESPGHRANILSADYDEIGIGIETGDFQGYDGVMITQNFGATDAVPDPVDPPVPPVPPEPVDPDPVDPVEPDPVDPVEPDPVDPVEPDPVDPVEPVAPTPVEPVDPQQPFDPDDFIAALTALLEDLFASLDFGPSDGWPSDDMVTFRMASDNEADDAPWRCDWMEPMVEASAPLAYDWDMV